MESSTVTILKEQILAAFKEDQADMKLTIKNEEHEEFYQVKMKNESTEGCLQEFFRVHSRLIQENFK